LQLLVWAPARLLTTIPAIATTLCGLIAGHWLRARRCDRAKLLLLVAAGGCCVTVGVMGHAWFPINKTLWTSTYVLLTAGTSCLALAVCFAVIGNKQIEIWAVPFHVLGVNALAAFVLSELLARTMVQRWWNLPHVDGKAGLDLHTFLYERLFMPLAVAELGSALWAVVYLVLIVGMMTAVYAVRPRIRF
jgi:predicted acyltransferase